KVANFSGCFSASSSIRPSTRFTEAARMVCTSLDCCRISRETFSGRAVLARVHEEDARDVELDAASMIAIPQVEGRALRNEEELREFLTSFDPGVRVGQRRLEVVGHVLVEL